MPLVIFLEPLKHTEADRTSGQSCTEGPGSHTRHLNNHLNNYNYLGFDAKSKGGWVPDGRLGETRRVELHPRHGHRVWGEEQGVVAVRDIKMGEFIFLKS